jgi:N-acetyltransferase
LGSMQQKSAEMELVPQVLEGNFVRLEPISSAMREEMQVALDVDPDAWAVQYLSGRGDQFQGYWRLMTAPLEASARIAFAVRSRATGKVIGTSSYHHISSRDCTLEIGSTFLRPEARGSYVNPEMKLLMLEHAFESGALRVQLTVDSRNLRSQAAVAKLGAMREGLLRQHLITWNGHHRDTVVFSILHTEWDLVRARLVQRLRVYGEAEIAGAEHAKSLVVSEARHSSAVEEGAA